MAVVTLKPGQSIANAMKAAKPGDTIRLRGGNYDQAINVRPPAGTAHARITLTVDPGERAVVRGLVDLIDLRYWTIEHVAFTQGAAKRLHLVKVVGGTLWDLDGIEVYGAHETGLLVGYSSTYGVPKGWMLRNSTLRDCGNTPAYLNPGRDAIGLVERNLFLRAGTENVKLGWGGTGVAAHPGGVGEVDFRYNTCVGGAPLGVTPPATSRPGPNLVIAEPSNERPVRAHHNLLVGSRVAWSTRIDNEEGQLGTNIEVVDNAYWAAEKFAYDFGKAPAVMAKMARNVRVDPRLDKSYRPTNPAAMGYGRYAP